MIEEVSTPHVPKAVSTQEVHRSETYMPHLPRQNAIAARPTASSFRKRHVTFSSGEPQFHESTADGYLGEPRQHAPPFENSRPIPRRAFSYTTFQRGRQDQPTTQKHSSEHAVIQYDDDENVAFTSSHSREMGSHRNMKMAKPPSSEGKKESDEEEHFIDGNYFFNYLVRNKAAEDYNMAEMLRERSRELQKTHWLFSHSRPNQNYPAYGADRLSASLPADYSNKLLNYYYYRDDAHRAHPPEVVNRRYQQHEPNRRYRGNPRQDIAFAGGLEIEIPPRRHGGLGGGGLRQSISADRLLMVPHSHRDSAKFGRHYFRAGPSYNQSTNYSSYSATNLAALPLHVETHDRQEVDVERRATSYFKGNASTSQRHDEKHTDFARSVNTKEHNNNNNNFFKGPQDNSLRDRPHESRYEAPEAATLTSNTGRYNVRTGRFEPVTGSQPYPKSVSYSDVSRGAVLNRYQNNNILNPNLVVGVDSNRTLFNVSGPAYFQLNDSKPSNIQRADHNVKRDLNRVNLVRVRGSEEDQTGRFKMDNPRGQAVSSGSFHDVPKHAPPTANQTWNEHFHEGFNRDFPSPDPRMSISWDASRFRPQFNNRYNPQQYQWSHHQATNVFQRPPPNIVDSSQSRPKNLHSVSFQNVPDSHEVHQKSVINRSQHFDTSGRKVVTWQDQDENGDRLLRSDPYATGEIQPADLSPPSNYVEDTFSREPSHSVIKGSTSPTGDSLLRNLSIIDLQNVDQFALFEVSLSKLSWTESFMGTSMLDKLNQYKFVVLNRHEEVLFVGTELDESMSDSLMSPHKSSFKVRLLDANGHDVIHFRRLYPLKPMRNFAVGNKKKYRLEVATPSGHVIGNVEKTYDSDTYYILEDRTGECLFLVQKSCICTCPLFWDYEFKILLPEGEAEVGEISWSYLTAQNEQFNGTEISFPTDLNTTSKLMLLGVCFLLNFSRWPSTYLDSVYNDKRRKDKFKLLGPRFLRPPQEGNKEITALLQTSPYDNGFYRNEEDLDYHPDIGRGGTNVSSS